jgi:Tfp pilus assembly protein PilV
VSVRNLWGSIHAKRHRPVGSHDDGFSIISVVIAFSMFVAVLAPAALLIQQSTLVSGDVQSRIIAANLATKQLELVRSQASYAFAQLVDNYLGTSTSTVPIGSVDYSITQNLQWSPGAYSPGGCGSSANGNTQLQPVLTATVSVTWPAKPAHEPPTSETSTFTPPVGQYSATSGDISIQVLSASGTGQPSIPVTVTGPSGSPSSTTVNTDSNGCAFFPFLQIGSYQVSLQSPSANMVFVDPTGNTNPSTTVGVEIGQISTYQFSYDQAATLTLPAPPSNYTVPSAVGLTLASPNLPGLGTIIKTPLPTTSANGETTISGLFPFPGGYQIWLGDCYTYQSGAQFSGVATSAVSGGSTTLAALGEYPAQIQVELNGAPVAGAQVSVNVMDPTLSTQPPYNTNCPTVSGSSTPSYQQPIIASTTTAPSLVELPLGYLQFQATATVNGAVVTGYFPPLTATPSYFDTTSGTGGPIVISLP